MGGVKIRRPPSIALLIAVVAAATAMLSAKTNAVPIAAIPIRSFFQASDRTAELARTLDFVVDDINAFRKNPFRLDHESKQSRLGDADTWSAMNAVCSSLRDGFMALICADAGRTFDAYWSLSETLHLPLIDILLPLSSSSASDGSGTTFDVSLQPSVAELLADFVVHKDWSQLVLFQDSESSAQLLDALFEAHTERKRNSSTAENPGGLTKPLHVELVRVPRDIQDFPHFLRHFHLSRADGTVNRILLDASDPARLRQMLVAIRAAQFNQLNYHYVVTNFDLQPYDVEMFQNGNINISGFQIINRETRSFWNLVKHVYNESVDITDHIDPTVAFAHDAMLVTWHAFLRVLTVNETLFEDSFRLGRLYNRDFPGIYCRPADDLENPHRPFSTFQHGRTIARALRSVSIGEDEGTLTGRIEFDRFGRRRNFDVTVVDLVSSAKSSFNKKELMIWRQGHGFFANRSVALHTRKPSADGSHKRNVRVATVLVEPFVMIKRGCEDGSPDVNRTECQGNSRFEGYCIDLLKLLADRIEDFQYDISISKTYGAKQPDGSWNGLIGALLKGEADVAVASLTINQDRERVVDFSKPYMTTGISIMIKKPDKQEFSVFSFMQPLSTEIWMYIIFAYVGVSVVIFLVSRFSPYEWRVEELANGSFTISNEFSVYNCLWFTLAAFMQQGTDILPRSISGRIASSAWWFFTMIIVSSYTANLAAFLTLEKMQAPIESVEDLAKQTKIKYGIQQGGSTAAFFKHSSVQIYQRMWRYMESQVPSVFTNSYAEGIERVRTHKGRYAFLLEATANEYANTRKPCDTMKVGANLNSVGYGVATPFGSDWKDHINLAILALQERGELKKLENKWWYDRGQCDQGITDGSSASLNLSKVAGIFYILMGGMLASMLAAMGEFLYRSRIEARKNHMSSIVNNFARSLKTALFSQLRLSVQGGAVAHPGSESYEALRRQKEASFLPASNKEDKRPRVDNLQLPYNTAV